MKKLIILFLAMVFILTACGMVEKIVSMPESTSSNSEEANSEADSEDYTEIFREVSQEELDEIQRLEERQKELEALKDLDIKEEELYSYNVCLMDEETGEVLYAIDEEEVVFPASLTKIMTTLVAIENVENFECTYSIDQETYDDLIWEDASMTGFLPGEEVCFTDLVYGTMMPSGADASVGLAISSSGSVENHVEKMNEKVKELALENTNFTNVTGLHDEDNYSTALDLAKLLRYSMSNELFSKVITKPYHITEPTDFHQDSLYLEYSVVNYANNNGITDYSILGGKTGFTEEAGLCLASLADIEGNRYILVTLGAEENDGHFQDAVSIYDKVFEKVSSLD